MALTILAIAFVALAAELSQAANPYCTINAANTLCKYTVNSAYLDFPSIIST